MSTMAIPKGNPHTSVPGICPVSRTPEQMFTPAVQGIETAHLQQANALVCGRKIFLDPLS
jgi:hypothetical protein